MLIEIVKGNVHIDGKRIFSALKDNIAEFYGEYGLSLADVHLIEYGDKYLVISCDHRMAQQVRSAVAYTDRIGDASILLRVSSVSGTLRRLRMGMK
jgi:RNase P/RNase MRP subunit POP5